ncbi:hypothetical protein D9M70_455250 [compost metagenome]
MADALRLLETAKTREEFEVLRKALLSAYQAGTLSQQEYAQATGVLSGRLKELGSAAGGTAALVSDLDEKLGDLKSVQDAISAARTDVDINNIRSALRKLYNDGEITAAQYNQELKRTSDRQKELKQAVDEGRKSQDAKNASDREAIKTSADLRRESGKRMEAERKAGDQAMQDRRRGAEEAQRDMADMEGFFGGVMTRAREPLAAMSEAALEAYDRLRGLSTVDVSLDTSSLETTTASLEKATRALGDLQAASRTLGMSGFGRWMTDTLVQSQQIQVEFLKQKRALQELLEGYEAGGGDLELFAARARSARNTLNLLNDSDLRALEGVIESATQKMEQLRQGSQSTLTAMQEELMQLRGETEALERSRFSGRRSDIQQQLADAQRAGDSEAAANLQRALSTLRDIEDETTRQRQQQAVNQRAEQAKKAAEPPPEPTKIVRFQAPRQAVDVPVAASFDETKLLDVLADAGMRSL